MSKFVSVNYENGRKCCYEVRAILFDPQEGVFIVGPSDCKGLKMNVSFSGEITVFSVPLGTAAKTCRTANFVFSQCDSEVESNKTIKVEYDNGIKKMMTAEELYDTLVSAMDLN